MSQPSRSPMPHPFPIEIVAELDALCVERERGQDMPRGPESAARAQRIEELQRQLLERPQPIPGTVLANARLERLVKAGSFGTVWRASGVASGLPCAVKVLHQSCASRARMLRQFRQGIAALRALKAAGAPPSIVQLIEVDDSQLAFSMTLVEGSDLTDMGRRGWPLEKKMQVFSGVCEAVRFAHQKGVLHRDLRPANILYDERAGCPVLTDFDQADVLALETTTAAAAARGLYTAPEQRLGRQERLLESDIYSLGQLLQYLLTEQNPGEGTAPRVPDDALSRVIATCTHEDPAQRYSDVDELQQDVRRWRSGLGVVALRQSPRPPTSIPPQPLPPFTRSPSSVATSAHHEEQDGPRRSTGRLVAWAAVAAFAAGAAVLGARYWKELQTETAAARPAPTPDAGAAPAPKKKPKKATKRPRAPNAPGSVPGDAISRMFRDNEATFLRCHSGVDVPADNLVGQVTTSFRVDAEGVISEAKLEQTTVKSSAVARCVVAAHNGLRLYAKPGQPTYGQSRYEIASMPD